MFTEEIYHKDGTIFYFKFDIGEVKKETLEEFYNKEKLDHPCKIISEQINVCDCAINCGGCSRSDKLIEIPKYISENIYYTILFAGFLFGFENVELPTNLNNYKVTVRTKSLRTSNFQFIYDFVEI